MRNSVQRSIVYHELRSKNNWVTMVNGKFWTCLYLVCTVTMCCACVPGFPLYCVQVCGVLVFLGHQAWWACPIGRLATPEEEDHTCI